MYTNPLFKLSSLRDHAIPFDKINTEHYLPAIDAAIAEAKQNIEKIKKNPNPANFENTIEALECSSEKLEYATGIYFNLFSAEANDEHQSLAAIISPKMAEYSSDISLDPELFERIKTVYNNRAQLKLTNEQSRLLEKYYKDFVRNGALLSSSDKEKLRAIDQELAIISPKFSENVLKATNAFELLIENKEELNGLPDGAIEAAALAAEQKGHKGKWLFNLQYPSYAPVLQYSSNRALREKLWKAFTSRSFNDAYDNQENVKRTAILRFQRAKILGYATHADYVLEERMAKTPTEVISFLKKLLLPSKKAALKELDELKAFAKSIGANFELKPWDTSYYSEKLKEQKYSFNEEELRPYFKLENVIDGAFEHARQLYGLTFRQIFDVPLYHQDVRTYEVRDEKTNDFIALFYADFFPRETKKGGAWATNLRDQGLMFGEVRRPHVSIVCNFTKPTPTKPSLLNFDEVQTLFHEFGHALHMMLSQCHYRSLGGANVYWDFVELPSQIMENWVKEKEGLDLFAKHYETGAPIPAELVEKINRSAKFQVGMFSLRQLSFGFLDMAWHHADPSEITDVDAFESKAIDDTRLLPKEPGANSSCSFSHIFAGGYSAGYYSYKWAEVLDADAFELFKEQGLFNKEIAQRFKENILTRGGTEHPMELYKKFRGREPQVDALLKRDGLHNND